MRGNRGFLIAVIALIALACLSACERPLSGAERTSVLAFSEAAMDNPFAGLEANDYTIFSRDFDTDMSELVPATRFADLSQDLVSELGPYRSRQVDQVTRSGEFSVVVYQVEFDQAESVRVGVAFHTRAPHAIAHLSFDSETIGWSSS